MALPLGWTEWAVDGGSPAAPRDAATVVLVRRAPQAEAFLLKRTRALEFAPGVCVFPGGSVDEQDADPAIGWAGPAPADFAARLGTSAERARALVCAAVRETFEEAGVLLADAPALAGAEAMAQARRALLDGSASLADLGLVLRADLLTPWARWVTPLVSPRRFDTWFFVATMPPGQAATAAPGESESGTWLRPAQALDAARAGDITLLPPTAVTLSELDADPDLAGARAGRRAITPLMPEVVMEDGRPWLALPEAVDYPL